ncbi:MAG TPA: CPXCG motif-containing cysteine-rich protein, partial [Gammaproteobacteria bacterium]|nr:CPXCG motif-containing cysteine-rich protein [Gammaproteobacteria bacterium]
MDALAPVEIQCPYCGETIEIVVDCSIENQRYIEDCQVCCRPIDLI